MFSGGYRTDHDDRQSPGPKTSSARRSSTTRTVWSTPSCRSTPEGMTMAPHTTRDGPVAGARRAPQGRGPPAGGRRGAASRPSSLGPVTPPNAPWPSSTRPTPRPGARVVRPRERGATRVPVARVDAAPSRHRARRAPHPPRPDPGLHRRLRPHGAGPVAVAPQGAGPGQRFEGRDEGEDRARPHRPGHRDGRGRARRHPAGPGPLRHRRRRGAGTPAGERLPQLPGVAPVPRWT